MDLTIISVSYFGRADLERLSASLKVAAPKVAWEWLVVNHAPEDLSGVAWPNEARLIWNGPNDGYAAGINRAVREAKGKYYLLLNPDTRVCPGTLERLVQLFEERPEVGVFFPHVVNPDGTPQQHVRRFYDWKSALYARWPWRRDPGPQFFREYLMLSRDPAKECEVDWGLGGTLATRAALKNEAGELLDPRYFLYFEDVDFCYSAWQRGWKVIAHPGPVIEHHHARHSKKLFSKALLLHGMSFLRFILKHRGLPGRPELKVAQKIERK